MWIIDIPRHYKAKAHVANCVKFKIRRKKDTTQHQIMALGAVSPMSEWSLFAVNALFPKKTADRWALNHTVNTPKIKTSSSRKCGIILGFLAPTVNISEFKTPRMGVTFTTKSGAFRQKPLPWDHLEFQPETPRSPVRRSGSAASHTTLFQPREEFPIVKPLAPPFKQCDETCRDFLEHWASLGPNSSDIAEPERPLPPNPKLAHPREERKPFNEMEYISRKRAVAPSPYTRERRTKKASRQQAEEQITPAESEAEMQRIQRIFRTY